MKTTLLLSRLLKSEGTEYLFCFPINPLIDAAAEAGIRPIVARTEHGVVGMADGYARALSGARPAVCAFQYGPGAENAYGAIAQAYSDSSPILCVPGGVPENRIDAKPNFEALKHYQHVTKWVARISRADRAAHLLQRAVTYLRNGRRGPVMLELPSDVSGAEVSEAAGVASYVSPRAAKSCADPADVADAATQLIKAKRLVIHAGAGVLWSRATPQLLELAELLQAPVMSTLSGKSAFPEDHPLSLGSGGMAWPRAVPHFLERADLIFAVGASLSISNFAIPLPAKVPVIQLAADERDFNKDHTANSFLLGDAGLVLQQINTELRKRLGAGGRRGDGSVEKEITEVRNRWLDEWSPRLLSTETPLNPYHVLHVLQQTVQDEDVIITHDAGNPRDQLTPFWRAKTPGSFVGWGRSTHLGYSLPLAMGIKLARPEATVIHVIGDTGFGECGMDLETAVRNAIGTVTVLLNNSCMGGYDKHMPYSSEHFRTRYTSGNYAMIARGLGAHAVRVEQPEQIAKAIREAIDVSKTGKPALIEFITKEDPVLSS